MNIFQLLKDGVTSPSPEETRALARQLGEALPPDATLALHGSLGVGKTTFTSGLALAFGIPGPVTSPTYTYYSIHKGTRTLVHLDAYRLSHPDQIEALLIEEFLESPWCLVVEWPDNTGSWLPQDALHLDLSIPTPGSHRIRLRHAPSRL